MKAAIWWSVRLGINFVKSTIQESFYRNGQLREELPVRKNRRHGVARTWHKNGLLATEEPYQNGLLHGVCRQWSEAGRLLGQYRMVHGTGVQRAWHDNGRLQMEFSTVRGDFSGRSRLWLWDGKLLAEEINLHGLPVTAGEYRAARLKDESLPQFRGKPGRPLPRNRATQKRIHEVFVRSLLEKPHRSEARQWLTKESNDKTARSLGRFKRASDATKFVDGLYRAGAVTVITPDLYRNKAGDQFADCLLVKLPKSAARRRATRKVCAQLRTRRLGAVEPDREMGESHLYLLLA